MTKDEFISYTKGIIALEMEKARLEMIKDWTVDIQLAGALKLIKDALDNITPEAPITYTQGVTNISTNTEMIPFYELCSCNPKNGGSGICGCVMGNKLVPKNSWGASNITTYEKNSI